MKVTYLGTGAAEGIPALFCNCDFCTAARSGGFVRSRSQLIVDETLSVDFPPDSFYHACKSKIDFSKIKYILVSHAHMDHFYAYDFILRGYKYAYDITEPTLAIYGNAETLDIFREDTRRELRADIAKSIELHEIAPLQEVRFGGYIVHTLKAQHSSRDPMIFSIEKDGKRMLHLHDTGTLPEESLAYLLSVVKAPYDLITFDCTFLFDETQPTARHMGLDENMRVLERLRACGLADGHTKKVITHFSHNSKPTLETLKRAEDEFGVIAAYDGLVLEI